MKRKISFEKRIDFPTMIGEVTTISLDKNLKFMDESSIVGELILSGKYKITEASRLEEVFNYNIPIDISLTENIDLETAKVDISDFYYKIEKDQVINCNIELTVEGMEIIDYNDKTILEERECDGDNYEDKEVEIPIKTQEVKEENIIDNNIEVLDEECVTNIIENDLLSNIIDNKDTYGSFCVYIVRQNETLNSIIEKYNTSIEEIEKYNDIKNIEIGTKLIIPIINNE